MPKSHQRSERNKMSLTYWQQQANRIDLTFTPTLIRKQSDTYKADEASYRHDVSYQEKAKVLSKVPKPLFLFNIVLFTGAVVH